MGMSTAALGTHSPFMNNFGKQNTEVKIIERLYLRGDLLGEGGQASCYEVVTRSEIEAKGAIKGK